MPLFALFVSYLFKLPKEITVGLILTGAAPGAMTSNVISYLSGGDVTYSVSFQKKQLFLQQFSQYGVSFRLRYWLIFGSFLK